MKQGKHIFQTKQRDVFEAQPGYLCEALLELVHMGFLINKTEYGDDGWIIEVVRA